MIIKMQPKKLDGKPLISAGDPEFYIGRLIVEVWYEPSSNKGTDQLDGTSFGRSLDEPKTLSMPRDQWLKLLLNAVERAKRHIGDALQQTPPRPPHE